MDPASEKNLFQLSEESEVAQLHAEVDAVNEEQRINQDVEVKFHSDQSIHQSAKSDLKVDRLPSKPLAYIVQKQSNLPFAFLILHLSSSHQLAVRFKSRLKKL